MHSAEESEWSEDDVASSLSAHVPSSACNPGSRSGTVTVDSTVPSLPRAASRPFLTPSEVSHSQSLHAIPIAATVPPLQLIAMVYATLKCAACIEHCSGSAS